MSPSTVLYVNKGRSIWSAVALLTLDEKQSRDTSNSLDLKVEDVDLAHAENCSVKFLREINPNGTVPALVVNKEGSIERIGDSVAVCEFLDRNIQPVGELQPSKETAAAADKIIQLVHAEIVEPSFTLISARNDAEMQFKLSAGPLTEYLTAREATLSAHLKAHSADPALADLIPFVEGKIARNTFAFTTYKTAGKSLDSLSEPEIKTREEFFARSSKIYDEGLPQAFKALEDLIVGPLSTGDKFTLPDAHLAAWVTRVVFACGGSVEKVEHLIGNGFVLGPKVKTFWATIQERASWKKNYGERLY